MITQEASSQSARTSVASGGRLSILSEKLSRLSISSNQSARASVASDSVLLHKKGDSGRLSHSYEDTDAQAISAHYSSRRNSKAPRLSATDVENQVGTLPGTINARNIRFQLFPRSSDAIERSISSVEQSPSIIEEEQSGSTKRQVIKIDAIQIVNAGRRQSLLRSPSSRHAIPKFPAVGKQSNTNLRASISAIEQGLLSPPVSPQSSSHRHKNKTLRGALGAILPDLYFTGTACSPTHSSNSGAMATGSPNETGERTNEELAAVEDNLHKLHVRIQYDDHRNDLIVNVIEGKSLRGNQGDASWTFSHL